MTQLWRALLQAGFPSTKEPPGLSRTDGKRPDGVTLIPWQRGKPLAWDVTVVHTLADSYVGSTALSPDSITEMAAERKAAKFITLPDTITFQSVAFETLGQLTNWCGIF